MLRFFRVYGMSCVATMAILYLSIAQKMPDLNLPDFDLKDKILHGGAYAVFSMILAYELYRQRYVFVEKKMAVWAIAFPIIYGGLIEILQEKFFPPRSGEWADWLADIIGVLVGFFIAKYIYPRYLKTERQGAACR